MGLLQIIQVINDRFRIETLMVNLGISPCSQGFCFPWIAPGGAQCRSTRCGTCGPRGAEKQQSRQQLPVSVAPQEVSEKSTCGSTIFRISNIGGPGFQRRSWSRHPASGMWLLEHVDNPIITISTCSTNQHVPWKSPNEHVDNPLVWNGRFSWDISI